MELKNIHKIHFIGIGGIGVSALARFFLRKNAQVTGSDEERSENIYILEQEGARVYIGHDKNHIISDIDAVVFSSAVNSDNTERMAAERLGIPSFEYSVMLGKIMDQFYGVAVSGTNGKTTTTALLGLMLEGAELDPVVVVGGKLREWKGNLRLGGGKYMLAEACEYRRHMLNLKPHIIVLTNIEEDHLDYYRDLEDIVKAFEEYVERLESEDVLVVNGDDLLVLRVAEKSKAHKIFYSTHKKAELVARNIKKESGRQEFRLFWKDIDLGVYALNVPGDFNIYNFLAAGAAALALGVEPKDLQKVANNFYGTWRRFERVGVCEGVPVFSDYAHHPTAVRKTLQAAKEFFPGKKFLAIFQPHQQNRTQRLFDEFAQSFDEADGLILSEIYQVSGREKEDLNISSRDLVQSIQNRPKHPEFIQYAANPQEAANIAKKIIKAYDAVLIMGAGNIYQAADLMIDTSH